MQIHVTGTAHAVTPQLRAYAEYKVFSRLAPLGRRVQLVQVLLIESSEEGETLCAAAADLGDAGCVRAHSRSGFPTAAIDGAADHLARAAAHRLALAAQG
jgi:ribosome-associated translation inhibitor RaiA